MKRARKKFYALLLGSGVALLVAYHLSFAKGMTQVSEFQRLSRMEEETWQVEKDLAHWQARNAQLNEVLGNSNKAGFEENLLNMVGLFCEAQRMDVEQFSEPEIGYQNGYRIETISVRVRGSFHQLLSLLHHMEEDFRSGRIVSLDFEKELDYKRRKEELYLKLYVQNIKPVEDEA